MSMWLDKYIDGCILIACELEIRKTQTISRCMCDDL